MFLFVMAENVHWKEHREGMSEHNWSSAQALINRYYR